MPSLFTRKTFQYFDAAKKNKFKEGWFEKNKKQYLESVKEPYSFLILEIARRFTEKLPGVVMNPRKIARPVRPAHKVKEHGHVKAGAMFFLSEKTTSQFEWNPGIYLHLGDEKGDNMIGMGLYGPSSRQIKRLRKAFASDYKTVDKILKDKKFRKYWGAPAEEKYKRFPKEYSESEPGAKYIWYKQFYVHRQFTRKEVTSKDFPELVIKSFEAAIPFFQWIREAIGTYNRQEMEREKALKADALAEGR